MPDPVNLRSPSSVSYHPQLFKTLKSPRSHPSMAATPSPSPSSSSSPPQPQSQSGSPESDSQSLLVSPKPILLAIEVPTQKKPQAVQWTPEETGNLIQAYQEKWYCLNRGQLKAHQWEEVTVTVAARCGYDDPTKTSTQCRHKMEKLRKRYRAEKRNGGGRSSAWPLFDLMDRMECGPQPISARPVNMVRFPNSVTKAHHHDAWMENDESEEEEDDNHKRLNSRSRSINNLIRKPSMIDRLSVRKREEEGKSGVGEKRLLLGLAAEMRAFAVRIAAVEKKKMQMMRETEKMRAEMESKRVKMILDSQSKMIEAIDKWSNGGPQKKAAQI